MGVLAARVPVDIKTSRTQGGDIFGEDTLVWMAPALDFIVISYANCSSTNANTGLALNDVATLLVTRYSSTAASGPLIETPASLPLRRVGVNFTFDYQTLPGVPYLVETSSDLKTWSPANGANGQTAIGLQSSFPDSSPVMRRFFRVRTVP